MAIRKNAPMEFVDAGLEDFGSPRTAKFLDQLDAATPWDALAHPIKQHREYNSSGQADRCGSRG